MYPYSNKNYKLYHLKPTENKELMDLTKDGRRNCFQIFRNPNCRNRYPKLLPNSEMAAEFRNNKLLLRSSENLIKGDLFFIQRLCESNFSYHYNILTFFFIMSKKPGHKLDKV